MAENSSSFLRFASLLLLKTKAPFSLGFIRVHFSDGLTGFELFFLSGSSVVLLQRGRSRRTTVALLRTLFETVQVGSYSFTPCDV
jgi:hypothetical protein